MMAKTKGKSCAGKVRYETKREASVAARDLSRRTLGFYQAYKCKHCGGLHIGHPPHRARRRQQW